MSCALSSPLFFPKISTSSIHVPRALLDSGIKLPPVDDMSRAVLASSYLTPRCGTERRCGARASPLQTSYLAKTKLVKTGFMSCARFRFLASRTCQTIKLEGSCPVLSFLALLKLEIVSTTMHGESEKRRIAALCAPVFCRDSEAADEVTDGESGKQRI
jgi:hypothetical protein